MVQEHATWLKDRDKPRHYPLLPVSDLQANAPMHHDLNFVHATRKELSSEVIALLQEDESLVLLLDTENLHGYAEQRAAFFDLMENGCDVPVIIGRDYTNLDELHLMLHSSTDLGALLLDGLGDGVMICPENSGSDAMVDRTAFGILQATRSRISKTEYISCPSCGRTLFDLQETTARIRARTSHLKGVKIGIMGCIVNGPGEMADADYGYVGTGPGVITLYKEKEVVKRNVPAADAVDELIALIRSGGDWVEPTN